MSPALNFRIVSPLPQDVCRCGVYAAEVIVPGQTDIKLCRACLTAVRATLKAALKALPRLPKREHPT